MDDNRSIMSSVYWDTASIRSDSTMAPDCFHTPTGSFMDLSIVGGADDNEHLSQEDSTHSGSVTPQGNESHHSRSKESSIKDVVIASEAEPNYSETIFEAKITPERPPPPKLQKYASVQLDTRSKSPEKKDWKHSFAKRLSFTKSRIMKSFSNHKHEQKHHHVSARSVFLNMRNSIRHLKGADKRKSGSHGGDNEPHTIKDTLGSDCDYFNFERSSVERNSEIINGSGSDEKETTPIKPRRQFPQDKYLTGSEEMLQKAYNSSGRKTEMHEDKSLFDLCSTLKDLFDFCPNSSSNSSHEMAPYVLDCVSAFLEMNKKQIEHTILAVNKDLGRAFDLMSDTLDLVDDFKKYKVEELLGSPGVCIVTDIDTKQKFVALKRTCPRNWVSFTGFLQHIEKESSTITFSSSSLDLLLDDQSWICYPAQSITNMYLERDCFESSRLTHSKLLLDSLLQLMVLLHGQVSGDQCPWAIKPSNVLLISSNVSLICVFDHSSLPAEKRHSTQSSESVNIRGDKSMRLAYQNSLMRLNSLVNNFLINPANCSHLISASFPLDYLFYILLKLHKDINVLLDSI